MIATLSLVLAISLPIIRSRVEYRNKKALIQGENIYNGALINSYTDALSNHALEEKIFNNRFSVDVYKNNWDTIFHLKEKCAENQIRAIAKMESINSINESILTLYNQEGLVFEENQWKNTKERSGNWYTILKQNLNELNTYFTNLNSCKF